MASGKPSRFWPRLLVYARALPRLLRRRRRPVCVQRILVAHHLLLGDTIMLAGLLKKLRRDFPTAAIDLLVPVAWLPLFGMAPYGVRALPYAPRSLDNHRQLLAGGPYDLALVPADNRWSWVACAMGARWIVAFAGGPGGSKDWPVDEHVEWPVLPEAWGDIASRLLPGPAPAPFVAGEWPAPARPVDFPALLAGSYAVLHLGASSPHKLWPAEHWQALAERLDQAGVQVLWSAGPGELDLVHAVDPSGRFRHLVGQLDMAGMWHLLAGARLLVSPDTGIAHLARLTGTPAVVLFGPGSPIISGPGRFWRDSLFEVVWIESMPCRDQNLLFERPLPWVRHCWRSVAECGNPLCIQQIQENDVILAIERITDLRLAKEEK